MFIANKHIFKFYILHTPSNYTPTDRQTAAYGRSWCQLLRIKRVTWSGRGSHGNILGFLDRSIYFFFQVAPQL
jgi:hypothetical protein